MGRLWEQVVDPQRLRKAWSEVLDNDAADGQLSRSVQRFEADLDNQLGRLETDLRYDAYSASDLFEVKIPDGDDERTLHIPAVRDRVLERAILDVVTPYVDPVLGPWSFAYRPGLGVVDAVEAVVELREEGLAWVLRTDVEQCFPSIPVTTARRLLAALVEDDDLMRLVDALLARPGRDDRGRRYVIPGLPQGGPLSPLLANLVLARVDEVVAGGGYPVVRYADDMVVAAMTQASAREAERILGTELRRLGMSLNDEKTVIMNFDEGFAFLGEDFGPRYPPAISGSGIAEPGRRSVYVAVQGSRVRIKAGRLLVESPKDVELLDVPTSQVARLVCFGSVGVSAGLRSWALSDGLDVVFASRRGAYLGTMHGLRDRPKADRLRAQLRAADDPRLLAVARSIVEAKVTKQAVVLRRFAREEHADRVRVTTGEMERMIRMLPDAHSREEIMGLEGAAARAYWPTYGALFSEPLRFEARSRQPPRDIPNSALSFLYTILLGECVCACAAAGMDPLYGVLHADDDRRPSLALDLLEEFRPWVVDQVVLRAARGNRLGVEHGRSESGKPGIFLTAGGRQAMLNAYESRMLTVTKGSLVGIAGSLRRHIYVQAQRLAASILDPELPWTGASWRS